ncbi:MAG: hypothetical protein A4C66_09790 [Nitrospira sp. HN-bin3]|uniref:thermonuclease family protein n=1 Tax=Nitrospira cf. moscoviensis SBR1015 TaxID=96242 RepID=UPI000A0C28AD|nr:thermonuclease family protein [Nitrospira cf. moscoviensis SBR1015]OQW41771.1 MAG: hypothetical protein A4C66_09790 [Nitrospira sp. HN-bin3]
MKPCLLVTTWVFIGWWLLQTPVHAFAARLDQSDLGSTLNQHCDLCWYPSPNDERSDRLPTYKQPRHKRPPDSRPQRYPKGRYKLGAGHKPIRLSALRSSSRPEVKLLSTLLVRVIDGDTIRVGNERIRLRGIDTPEMSEFDGVVAKQRLEEFLRGGSIRIVPYARDVYHRLIADVFVNGENVADLLRRDGLSKPG